MASSEYQRFVVLITKPDPGYQARVIHSPAGSGAAVNFELPEEWIGLSLWDTPELGHHNPTTKEVESVDPAMRVGRFLYDKIFAGEVGQSLLLSLERARDRLRIVLQFDDELPELSDLPWELLYSSYLDRPLAPSIETPLVRYLEVNQGRPMQPVSPPLVVLGVLSNPSGLTSLAVEDEWQRVQDAVARLGEDKIKLDRVRATWGALRSRLREGPVHVLHFIGHGLFDTVAGQGALIFEDEDGSPAPIRADHFKLLVHDHASLRLVFLNACEGAEGGRSDSFAGVAQQLVQQGVPVVIAMQFPVTDRAAQILSREFYRALAEGYPMDAALSEARIAVLGLPDSLEWATPILFSGQEDLSLLETSGLTRDFPGSGSAAYPIDPVSQGAGPERETQQPDGDSSVQTVSDRFVGRSVLLPKDQLPLVGRQAEWRRLQNLWQAALGGSPHMVVISGTAGIGKTRLAEELMRWADQHGALIARTRWYAIRGAPAYSAVAELLRSQALRGHLDRLDLVWLAQISRLLPELHEQRPDLPLPPPQTESLEINLFHDAITKAVLAPDQTLLLVLDDLQWCDAETLTWLHHLFRYARNERLLVVGTLRDDEIDGSHPIIALKTQLMRDDLITEIALAPLSADDTAKLASHYLQEDLSPDQNADLFQDTAGNPLFVVEMARAKKDQVEARSSAIVQAGVPAKIHNIIQSRFSLLSEEAQAVARLAAVMGRSFDYAVLCAASSGDEEQVIDLLDELLQRQIIREQSGDTFDFSHDRIRDVIYSDVSRVRRRLYHRKVAEALETIHQADLDAVSGDLAAHYEMAGNTAKAGHYLFRAGVVAESRAANDDAIDYLTRSTRLLPEYEKADAFIELGWVFEVVGQRHKAAESYEASLVAAKRSGNMRALALCESMYGCLLGQLNEFGRANELLSHSLAIYTPIPSPIRS